MSCSRPFSEHNTSLLDHLSVAKHPAAVDMQEERYDCEYYYQRHKMCLQKETSKQEVIDHSTCRVQLANFWSESTCIANRKCKPSEL